MEKAREKHEQQKNIIKSLSLHNRTPFFIGYQILLPRTFSPVGKLSPHFLLLEITKMFPITSVLFIVRRSAVENASLEIPSSWAIRSARKYSRNELNERNSFPLTINHRNNRQAYQMPEEERKRWLPENWDVSLPHFFPLLWNLSLKFNLQSGCVLLSCLCEQ